MNTNPIQTVLEAEMAARQAIESARQDADKAIKEARAQAQRMLERNEARTERAIKRYEEKNALDLQTEIDQLNKDAENATRAFIDAVEKRLPEIADKVFDSIWPTRR